jgi:hypothetical protein
VSQVRQREEESQRLDRNFNLVLSSFLKELKEVMQKDLCKKMVEMSAFKMVEDWFDDEQQKAKVDFVILFIFYLVHCPHVNSEHFSFTTLAMLLE